MRKLFYIAPVKRKYYFNTITENIEGIKGISIESITMIDYSKTRALNRAEKFAPTVFRNKVQQVEYSRDEIA